MWMKGGTLLILGSRFPGDDNEFLQLVQHDLYGHNLDRLFFGARERYLRSVRLVGTETQLGKLLESTYSFDHRTLQMTHDIIAAQYRLLYDNHGQMPLPFPGYTPYKDWLARQWLDYYANEMASLIDIDAFTLNVLHATVYENTPAGYGAEDQLVMLLAGRYPRLAECSDLFQSMPTRSHQRPDYL